MGEDPIPVRTSTVLLPVPADRFEALLERLPQTDEGAAAADQLRRGGPLSDENKKVIIRTLRIWIDDRGIGDMGADLNDLRHELMRDLNIPPWDTE